MATVTEEGTGFALSGLSLVDLTVLAAVLEHTAERWADLAWDPGTDLEVETMRALLALDSDLDTYLAGRIATCLRG